LQGPVGEQGITGPIGDQGPKGDIGPIVSWYSLSLIPHLKDDDSYLSLG
jgi:hypothetical protein